MARKSFRVGLALFIVSAVPGARAVATEITVTPATFNRAIATAKGGDTLRLVGSFGATEISNRFYRSNVVLDASQATFTGTLTLRYDKNLSIMGGSFNIVGAPAYTRAVVVYGGGNIVLDGPTVVGSAGGLGIVFNGTRNARVANGVFSGLQVGIVLGSVTNGTATNNKIDRAVSDGIDIANSHHIIASNNSCSGGIPGPGVHPDCIQLWSVDGNPLQSDITVRDNTATGPTQGFTAFNSMGGELRVQMINNSVDSSYPQGIACYDCIDSSISYNTLSTLPGAEHITHLAVIGGRRNVVVGNTIEPYDGLSRTNLSSRDFAGYGAGLDQSPDLVSLVSAEPTIRTGNSVVTEPSVWAMVLTGFAAVGAAVRRTRTGKFHPEQ